MKTLDLNTRLVNNIQWADMTVMPLINDFSALEREQIKLELTYSKRVFKQKVSKFVKSIDSTKLSVWFEEYINKLDALELDDKASKYKEAHVELLSTLKTPITKVFNKFLVEVLMTKFSKQKYIDLDAIAYKVGLKVANKSMKDDTFLCLSLGLNLANFFEDIGVIKITQIKNNEGHNIYTITTTIDDAILAEQAKEYRANAPMFIEPIQHTPLQVGGYVLDRGLMLNKANTVTHSKKLYDTVNYLQNVPYNLRTTNTIIQNWFTTDRWYDDNLNIMKGEQAKFITDLEIFMNKTLYFPIGADDRGRLYSRANYIDYQGDKYQKSMLKFANEEVLNEDGIKALKINIVNEVYSDKCTFSQALEWFDNNEPRLKDLVKANPIATVLYQDYLKGIQGLPVGTITHWDCTNSGLQVYSMLGLDELGASLCNVKFEKTVADAYGKLAEMLCKLTKSNNFNRDTVKTAFMVFLYGSGSALLLSDDIYDSRYPNLLAAFPDDYKQTAWDLFTEAMEKIAPAALKLMELIYKFKTTDSKYRWIMPDGFIVDIQVTDKSAKPCKGFRLSPDGKIHQGTINVLKPLEVNTYDKSLAPNVIHSIDAYILREVARRLKAKGIALSTIHDSFGVHPNYAFILMQVFREVIADTSTMQLLEDILSQIDSNKYKIAQERGLFIKGNLTTEDILNSMYMLR